jgi:hypothetical protein
MNPTKSLRVSGSPFSEMPGALVVLGPVRLNPDAAGDLTHAQLGKVGLLLRIEDDARDAQRPTEQVAQEILVIDEQEVAEDDGVDDGGRLSRDPPCRFLSPGFQRV